MTKLLSVREAAAYLRISSRILRIYERRGDIRSVRYPSVHGEGKRRTRLFTQEALDRFLIESQSEAVLAAVHNPDSEVSQSVQKLDTTVQGQSGQKGGNIHWMQSRAAK